LKADAEAAEKLAGFKKQKAITLPIHIGKQALFTMKVHYGKFLILLTKKTNRIQIGSRSSNRRMG
jgi:hypothetical protein